MIVFLLASALVAFSPDQALASPASAIRYTKIPDSKSTGLDKFQCKGRFDRPGLLNSIGYSDAKLRNGVPCRKADFDGNGSADYWIYSCDEYLIACKSVVVLMANKKVNKAVHLSRNMNTPDVVEARKSKDYDYLKTFGCKMPSVDALVELGDGEGRENRIYLLNKQKNDFYEFSHCETAESEDLTS